ncbi:MAG: hypothetical protein KME29_04905 [Calothrix sp. FI2-JRJ7]|jgi:predicted GIY-YIG superfamily endonuclease|nr:hypothetical protein [Calothrix sp. FI2-JRJ7]
MEFVEAIGKKISNCERLKHLCTDGVTGHAIIHQKSCMTCIRWLYEYDVDRFNEILGRALKAKTPSRYNIVNFAINKEHNFDGLEIVPRQENPILQSIINSCSPFRIPQDISKIPDSPGVYIVAINNKNSKRIAYVGSSLNIHLRITTHHVKELEIFTKSGVELLLYCLLFPLEGTEQAMRDTELHLIHELKPSLNKRY